MRNDALASWLVAVMSTLGCSVANTNEPSGGPPAGAPANLWQRCSPDLSSCDVWIMSLDGTSSRNLTPNTDSAVDFDMQWSHDHSKIVFSSTRGGNPDIYVMNADGSGVTQLTRDPGFESFGSFSPDDKRIVFSRGVPVSTPSGTTTAKLQLHTMNVDGSDVTRISTSTADEEEAAFSPDGTKILFDSDRTGTFQLYLIGVDGSGLTPLTHETTEDRYPSWSPDGKKIVFGSKRTGNSELYAMNADGTGVTRLTTNAGALNSDPAWSSDGATILFASTRDGNAEIYAMDADGSNQRRLTINPLFDAGPFAW